MTMQWADYNYPNRRVHAGRLEIPFQHFFATYSNIFNVNINQLSHSNNILRCARSSTVLQRCMSIWLVVVVMWHQDSFQAEWYSFIFRNPFASLTLPIPLTSSVAFNKASRGEQIYE